MAEHNTASEQTAVEMAIFLLLGMAVLFFYFVPQVITIPWAAFRWIESFLWTHVVGSLPFTDYISEPHRQLRVFLSNNYWWEFEYATIGEIENVLSFRTTWLYVLIPIPSVWRVITKKTQQHHMRKILNLEEMLEQESKVWRYTRYLTKINPQKYSMDVNKSCFAMREAIYSGLKRTKALTVDRDKGVVNYDEKVLNQVFESQLKMPIKDVTELKGDAKLLFCLFSLREDTLENIYSMKEMKQAERQKKLMKIVRFFYNRIPFGEKFKLKNTIDNKILDLDRYTLALVNESKAHETLRIDLLGDKSHAYIGEFPQKYIDRHVDAIFKKAIKNKQIKEFYSQHAYVETMLRRLLYEGRRYGKMPPNHFSWLKIHDRHLWYSLTDEGLPGAGFECAGVMAHYELEKACRMAMRFPDVDQLLKNIPRVTTVKEFDAIPCYMEHPIAKDHPYNPNLEHEEHLRKIEEDINYKMEQMKLEQQI